MYLSDDDVAGLPQKVVAWIKAVEGWHARHEAEHRKAELEAVPLPSVFGGIDPFVTPLPTDGPQAMGQLYSMLCVVHAENLRIEKRQKSVENKLDYDSIQRGYYASTDKPNTEKRLGDLEQFKAELDHWRRQLT
jgi:hypothetical protein